MPLLHWKQQYSIGIDAVDYEHQELIDLINRTHDEWCVTGSSERTDQFLGDVLCAISAHFALEERFMRERQYEDLAVHKEDHERLLDELRDIMDAFEADPAALTETLGTRLETWFGRHFETLDAKLHKELGPHTS